MADVDYLEALQKFQASGGTDIKQFLDQHTRPNQTTPGPGPIAGPIVQAAPQTTVQAAVPQTNIVRQVMAPPPPVATGAVGALPMSAHSRILGEARPPAPITVTPANQPTAPRPAPNVFSQPRTPALGTAPAQPAATPPDDPFRFRLPSEKKSGKDFLTGARIAAVDEDSPPGAPGYSTGPLANPKPTASPKPKPAGQRMAAASALPRNRNQRAIDPTTPRIFAGAA